MIKQVFIFILLLANYAFYSQCVPDSIYQDSTANIWPASGFPDGMVGVNYYQHWDMKAPLTLIEATLGDTSLVTIDTFGSIIYIGDWPVDSVVTVDVYDVPPGLTVDCSMDNCTYVGGQIGCANIYGVPTTQGTYAVDLVTNLYTHGIVTINVGGVPLTLPVEFDYFSVTGAYDTVHRYSISILESTGIPELQESVEIIRILNNRANIGLELESNRNENYLLTIHNILGKSIYSSYLSILNGRNVYNLNDLNLISNGVYIISLSNHLNSYHKKIHVY